MKRLFLQEIIRKTVVFLLSVLMIINGMMVFSSAASYRMEDILGVYEGYYYATQGQTGVTLTVYEEDQEVKAIFEFYNLPNRTNAKEGSYYMTVSVKEDGSFYFKAGSWIEHPSNYLTLDVNASLNGYVLSGTVTTSGQNTFYAEKANHAYNEVKDNIFNDHRYEVVDEGMTWTEAEAYAQERGGYLTVITSQEEQDYVENLIRNGNKLQYWIGGYRTKNGSMAWVTGEEFDYRHFIEGEPDNYLGCETALQMLRVENPRNASSNQGEWNDAPDDNVIPGEEDYFSLNNVGFVIEYGVWSDASQWADDELEDAYEKGLIPDVLIGKDLDQPITRGEFAAVADKLYQELSGNRMIIAMNAPFTDIYETAERLYILKAFNYQIVNGTSLTTYDPDDLLTREQMATMLTRVYKKYVWADYSIEEDIRYPLQFTRGQKFVDDALISSYAYESVYFMAANHIINGMGDNRFAPRNMTSAESAAKYANATREQALILSSRTMDQLGISSEAS